MKTSAYVRKLFLTLFAVLILAGAANAQEVIVFNSYQELPGKGVELSRVIDSEVASELARVEGLRWKAFYYDPASGARGSVLVWENDGAWQNYLKSDLRKALVNKVKPLIKGTVVSKGFLIQQAKN